jgi:hypothetical protein
MGSVSKAIKRVIPKEIQPILPIAASMFGGPLVGSALGGIGSLAARPVLTQALASGLTSAGVDFLTSGKVDPKTLATSTLLGAGGQYFKDIGAGNKGIMGLDLSKKAQEEFGKLGDLIAPTGIDKSGKFDISGDIVKSGATAVTAGGSIAAYNAAEQAQRDYDEMMAGKEADAAADRQARIDFITQNMQLAGFSQEEIDDALRNAGFQNGGRVGFKEGGDSSNILRNFRDAFSEIIGFPSYVLRDEQEFLKDLLEDPDDLSMKEIKAQMKSENAPTRKYLDNLSGEEKKDALNKIIDDQIKADLGRTSGLFEALESLRSRGMAMSEGGSSSIEQQKRENYFDLKRDEFMSMSEYLQSGLSDTDLRSGAAEGGIMNLKVKGMPAEMDLRRGGFVPIGAKEKADDVPARLSKNEFVMTADAVRAAGGGSVNKGAKKMYDLMNKLEARV